MGCDATAFLYRGVIFPESYTFPWDAEPYGGDIEEWWLFKVVGYVRPFELYDDSGEYLPGPAPSESRISEYYKDARDALKRNPLPISEDFAGADGCEYRILASWLIEAEWSGQEIEIPPDDPEADARLVAFLETHCQPIEEYDEAPEFVPKLRLSARYW